MTRATPVSEANDRGLVERVRKLLDKAAATTNQHEADAFSLKAAELIARYRIDPERLAGHDDELLTVREIPLGRGAYVRARLALLMAVAHGHDAQVLFNSTPTGTVAFVAGFSTDLDVVEVMYHSLHSQAASQMAGQRRGTSAATQQFRRSFLFGYAERVREEIADSRQRVESNGRPAGRSAQTDLSLVLRQRGERVDEYVNERFGRVRTARASRGAETTAWSAGVAAGARADVGRARLAGRRSLGPG